MASELASAVAHIHACGVVHGDITPSNVLIDGEGHARLADFGSAVLEGDTVVPLPGGHTPQFAAPEVRRGHGATTAADVYGLSATVAHLLGGDLGGRPPRSTSAAKVHGPPGAASPIGGNGGRPAGSVRMNPDSNPP